MAPFWVYRWTSVLDRTDLPEYKEGEEDATMIVEGLISVVIEEIVVGETVVVVLVVVEIVDDKTEVAVDVKFVAVVVDVVDWDVDTLLDELLNETGGIELLTDVDRDQTGWGLTLEQGKEDDKEEEEEIDPVVVVNVVVAVVVEVNVESVVVDEDDKVTKVTPLLLVVVLLVIELLVELFTDVQLALTVVPGLLHKSNTPLEWLVNPGLGAGELEVDVGV